MKQYLWSEIEKWFTDFFHSKTKAEMLFEQRERFRKELVEKIKRDMKKTEEIIKHWPKGA